MPDNKKNTKGFIYKQEYNPENELVKLYDAVSQDLDIGSFMEFESKMRTPDDRERFYDIVQNEGFDLGEYKKYEQRLSGQKAPLTDFIKEGISKVDEEIKKKKDYKPEKLEENKDLKESLDNAKFTFDTKIDEDYLEKHTVESEDFNYSKMMIDNATDLKRQEYLESLKPIQKKLEKEVERLTVDVRSDQEWLDNINNIVNESKVKAEESGASTEDIFKLDKKLDEAYLKSHTIAKTEYGDRSSFELEGAKLSLDLINDAIKYVERSDMSVLESIYKSDLLKDVVSFGAEELVRNIDVLEIAKKYDRGEKLKEQEQVALWAYGMNQLTRDEIPQELSAMVGDGIVESIPFIIDMALTGGVKKTVEKGGEKLALKLIEKGTKKSVAKFLGKTTANLLGNIPRALAFRDFREGVVERQIGVIQPTLTEEGKLTGIPLKETQAGIGEALTKAWASTYISITVESAGSGMKYIKNSPGIRKVTDKVLLKTIGKIPKIPITNNISANTLNQISKATDFNSWLEEWGEEIVEPYLQSLVVGDQKLNEVWDSKSMLAAGLSVGLMRGGMVATSFKIGGNQYERDQAMLSLKAAEENISNSDIASINKILKGQSLEENAEQFDNFLREKTDKGADEEYIKSLNDYAVNKTVVDEMLNSEQEYENEIEKVPVKEEIVEPKTKEYEKEVMQQEIREKGGEAVSEEITEPVISENQKNEILTSLEFQKVRNIAQEAKTSEEFINKIESENIPIELQNKLKEAYRTDNLADVSKSLKTDLKIQEQAEIVVPEIKQEPTEKVSTKKFSVIETKVSKGKKLTEAEKKIWRDNQSAPKGYLIDYEGNLKPIIKKDAKEFEGGQMRPESPEKGQIKGISDKDLSSIYRTKLQDWQKVKEQSVRKIGDLKEKTPTQLIEESQSTNEINYLLTTNQIAPGKQVNNKINGLIEEGKIEDKDKRIPAIEAQRAINTEADIISAIEKDVGKDRVANLKERKSELLDSLSGRLGRIANLKYAVGEDGKKPDVVKELTGVIKDLAELGIINLELGTKAAIDKLKQYLGDKNKEALKVIEDNRKSLEEEIEPEVKKIKERKKAEKAEKKAEKEAKEKVLKEEQERIEQEKITKANQREASEIIEESINEEEKAIKEIAKENKGAFLKWFNRTAVDQSANLKNAIIKEDSDLGRRAVDYFNLQSGASGRNNREFNKAREKILGKIGNIMSLSEQTALEQYIKFNRIIELDKLYDKRNEKRIKHSHGIQLEGAQKVVNAIKNGDKATLERLGIKGKFDFERIKKAADSYYETMRNNLTRLYEEGMINLEAYNSMREEQPYYSRRQYLDKFIKKIDNNGNISGIDGLSGGSFGAILTDLQTLLADNISRTNNMIFRSRAMKSFSDFSLENKDNDIVKNAELALEYFEKLDEEVKKPPVEREFIEPVFKPAPEGYKGYDYMSDGKRGRIFINNEYVSEFEVKNDSDMTLTKKVLSLISGNAILKISATGYNPEFFIKNIPLDMLHILTTTEAYSSIYPIATAQMFSDMKRVLPDLLKRKGRFLDYIDEGGSMDFLTTQGSFTVEKFKHYNNLNVAWKELTDKLAYLGNTSELLTRLALRERYIQNGIKDFEKENNRKPDAKELREIQFRATAGARNYLDFAQGGKTIKFLNSVIPYLNAGIQVTRGTLRAAKRSPKVFWGKITQLALTAGGLAAYNMGLVGFGDDEEKEERRLYYLNKIPERTKADNFILMTNFSFIDRNGEKQYFCFKFPKDNFQKLITGIVEDGIGQATGSGTKVVNKRRWDEMQSMISNFTDLGNMPPIMRGILGYKMNMDFYYNTPLWNGKDFGDDKSLEIIPGKTPERFIAMSKIPLGKNRLSPVRSQYFAQQFFTRSNVIGTWIGEALDWGVIKSDPDIVNTLNKDINEKFFRKPFIRRFFFSTTSYKKDGPVKEMLYKHNRERQATDLKLKQMFAHGKTENEIIEFITSIDNPNENNRLINKYFSLKNKEQVDYHIRELVYVPSDVKAESFFELYKTAKTEEKRNAIVSDAVKVGGVITGGIFMEKLRSFMEQDGEIDFEKFLEKYSTEQEKVMESRAGDYERIMEKYAKELEKKY